MRQVLYTYINLESMIKQILHVRFKEFQPDTPGFEQFSKTWWIYQEVKEIITTSGYSTIKFMDGKQIKVKEGSYELRTRKLRSWRQ